MIDAPAAIDPALVVQVQPSLDRLGRVYPSWDAYIALVRSMPYFADGGWDADLERYFRADVVVHPDGTVQARCRPEHIEQVIEGEIVVDWPALSARIDQPTLLVRAPGSFGPRRLAASPHPGGRRRDGSEDGRLHGRRRGRQPHHVHVRRGSAGADRRRGGVPGRRSEP